MKIYSLKIALTGISPMVWRRFRIAGNTSLADLHYIIQILYGWDNEYLHQFHIYGKDYGLSYEGGIYYTDDPHEIDLDKFAFEKNDKFTYEYNFFEHVFHDLRVENVEEISETKFIPYCIKGSGMPGVAKGDETEMILKIIEAAANKAPREKLLRLVEKASSMLFNCKKINDQLAELPLDAYTCKDPNDGGTTS